MGVWSCPPARVPGKTLWSEMDIGGFYPLPRETARILPTPHPQLGPAGWQKSLPRNSELSLSFSELDSGYKMRAKIAQILKETEASSMNVLIRVLAGIGGHAQWEWGWGQWGGWGVGGRIGGQVAKVWAESWETSKGLWCGGGSGCGGNGDTLPFNPPLLSTPAAPLTDSDKGEWNQPPRLSW